MITLFVSYGDPATGAWESLSADPLIPNSELYTTEETQSENFGLADLPVTLPSGESFQVSAAFTASNLGISVVVQQECATLLNVSCYKDSLENFDPSIMFLTPGGTHVSIMLGTDS